MELVDGTPRDNYCSAICLTFHSLVGILLGTLSPRFGFFARTPLRILNVLPMQSVGIFSAAISAAVASTVSKCVALL